jgi:hypothetical protein
MDAWLPDNAVPPSPSVPGKRLSGISRRGMGALESEPALLGPASQANEVDIAALVDFAG